MNRSGQIGTATETAVVRVLRSHGWPSAERRRLEGSLDRGDVTGTPGIVWEVKGGESARRASDLQVVVWLRETERERENADADHGVLVVARRGIGASNASRWWAIVTVETLAELLTGIEGYGVIPAVAMKPVRLQLEDVCSLLHAAGYGDERVVA